MRDSNASQKMSSAMRDRHRYRLENANVYKKYVIVRKKLKKVIVVRGSRGLQITELQDLQFGVVM